MNLVFRLNSLKIMNIYKFSILLGSFIYAYFYAKPLLNVFLTVIATVTILEILYRFNSKNTLKNKLFYSNWNETGNPNTFLSDDFDITNSIKFIENYNKNHKNNLLNLKSFALKGLSNAFHQDICYGKISAGNFIKKNKVDICVELKNKFNENYYITL